MSSNFQEWPKQQKKLLKYSDNVWRKSVCQQLTDTSILMLWVFQIILQMLPQKKKKVISLIHYILWTCYPLTS